MEARVEFDGGAVDLEGDVLMLLLLLLLMDVFWLLVVEQRRGLRMWLGLNFEAGAQGEVAPAACEADPLEHWDGEGGGVWVVEGEGVEGESEEVVG